MFLKLLLITVLVTFITATDYCNLHCLSTDKPHTVCQRKNCSAAQECGENHKVLKLSLQERQFIVNLHNDLRSKVALGQLKCPEIANMKKIAYNSELEFIAQCWANACKINPLQNDVCRKTLVHSYVGQNLFLLQTNKRNVTDLLQKAFSDWKSQLKNFQPNWYNQDDWKNGSDFNKVKHFTQLIWADTSQIGCGISYFKDNLLLVCNYGPGGNVRQHSIYMKGKAGMKCPRGLVPEKSTGLCTHP